MTEFEKVIMNRDEVSAEEAKRQRDEAREELYAMLEDGDSYDDIEDMLMYDYGLEMDYIFDLI
jgi:hypothetical protein